MNKLLDLGELNKLIFSVALACVTASAAGAIESAEQLLASEPPELAERLLDRKLLVLEDIGADNDSFVVAYVVFERPVGDVVRLLRQAARQTEYRPELAQVETIETFENGRVDEQRMRIMFTNLVYRLRYRDLADTKGRLEWTLDPEFDNDMSTFEGFWEFHPFERNPDRTLARFGSKVDVGPTVPQFIQKTMSRKTVLRYLENARLWIDSDGTWRP
jgi:hypothetical protein